jgi:hypothetical protein
METTKSSQESMSEIPQGKGDLAKLFPTLTSINTCLQQIQQAVSTPSPETTAVLDRLDSLELKMTVNQPVTSVPLPAVETHHHHHHLKKGLIIALASILVNFLLSAALYLSYERGQQYEANDLKYRALRVQGIPQLNAWLGYLDSMYLMHPERIQNYVDQQEEKRLNTPAGADLASNPPASARGSAGEKKKKGH